MNIYQKYQTSDNLKLIADLETKPVSIVSSADFVELFTNDLGVNVEFSASSFEISIELIVFAIVVAVSNVDSVKVCVNISKEEG